MIPANDLRKGTTFELDGTPWKVLEYKHVKVARGSATIKIKAKNILTGSTVEKSFKSGDKVQDADITRFPAQFLYKEGDDDFIFMDKNTFEQATIKRDLLDLGVNFLQDNMDVEIEFYNSQPIGITLPTSVVLEVTDTMDVSKGFVVQVPAFVKNGDKIKINTENGAYVERA